MVRKQDEGGKSKRTDQRMEEVMIPSGPLGRREVMRSTIR
jgi:hypothetical protein